MHTRGLKPGLGGWPASLRYRANMKHSPTNLILPGLTAAVTVWPDRNVVAIHRTFLKLNGMGKAPVSPPKMAFGPIGAGAVQLAPTQPTLGVAEGIESAFSAMQLFEIPAWAALGSRMDRVTLPEQVIEVHIFGDNGGPGHVAAERAANIFTQQGRRVVLRFPMTHCGAGAGGKNLTSPYRR